MAKAANDYHEVSLLADVVDTNIMRCKEEYVNRQNPSYAGFGSLSTFSLFVKNTLRGLEFVKIFKKGVDNHRIIGYA